ncbi:hypothetical protein GUJ93_ZPchr0014g47470 [Zizania palustris]|uniref:DUF7597 domain-containing protein n=1 Tax=Zizania palustris TaxID=103762 RepID=A0A8J5VV18_ZIZPA|nr:hypothetical protein GUJ93_ZPchr0014g47470 [Zizania palustris]
MDNFPVDPIPFLPRGGGISDGGGSLRKLRNVVTLSGQHIRRHEDMVIAECEAPLILAECHDLLQQINTHVTQRLHACLSADIDMPDAASCEAALRDDTLELSIEATQKKTTSPITIVYKRRCRALEVISPSKEMVATPQKQKTQTSQVGLRRSARIRNKLLGFRKGDPSRQTKLHHMQAGPSSGTKGKEVLMPAMPSLQDFLNATAAGMFHTPLSIDQIQHSAIHICDIDAAQVSKDKLSADLGGDSQIVPFTGSSFNENDKENH